MLDPDSLIGKTLGEKYVVDSITGTGQFGVTYAGRDTDLNSPVAIKVLLTPNPPSSWIEEPRRAAKLRNKPNSHVAQVYGFGNYQTYNKDTEENEAYAYIISELVDGQSLEDYLRGNPNISQEFVMRFVTNMCEAIAAMQRVEMEHGDLHEGNIMLEDPAFYESGELRRIKIIDFGISRSFRGGAFSKDIDSLKRIIRRLYEINQRYESELIESDKNLRNWLPILIKELDDTSSGMKMFEPIEIIRKMQSFEAQSRLREVKSLKPLTGPFEFLDVIEIPEDTSLLHDLFVPMPWYQELETFGNTLISGPRGSGKSMILRHMRFKTKLHSESFRKEGYLKEQFIGFYLHCHPSIYLPFSARHIDYNQNSSDMILHYINLQLTFEIIDTLVNAEKYGIFSISNNAKNEILRFIEAQLQKKGTILAESDLLMNARSLIERELKLTQISIIQGKSFENRTSVGYLFELCSLLEIIDYFKNRKFFFLIDDYSDPNVNFNIQRSFNRVIRSKNPKFCFKISTEKFSLDLLDFEGKRLQQNHEYHYIDLGQKFLSQPHEKDVRDFMAKVLNRRLEYAGIKKTAFEIFGNYKTQGKSFGASLAITKSRKSTLYAGFHIISMLCSGDMRTLLELCKEIFREARWKAENPELIPYEVQDRAIRQFSRSYLAEIKGYPSGDDMLTIAAAFGEICKTYLYEYGPITKQKGRYYELLRIEIESVRPLMDEKARHLYELLLKYSVFIDGGEGYPRREALTTRLIFRRIYTPAFQISYRNKDALRMSPKLFEYFILNPNKFKKNGTAFLKQLEKRRTHTRIDGQTELAIESLSAEEKEDNNED